MKPYDQRSRIVDVEVTVRRLATPSVRDVVTAARIEAGPAIDKWAAWQDYRRRHPDRRYAVAKRVPPAGNCGGTD